MNEFLSEKYVETVERLALGLEPLDGLRGGRLAYPVRVEIEGPLPRPRMCERAPYGHVTRSTDPRPAFDRHDSCLHALIYHPALRDSIVVRIYDCRRQYVSRRFRVPLLTRAAAEAAPYTQRVRRPVLFPGAAYDVIEQSTGLRGRVTRNRRPVRWARVEARTGDPERVVGRAHGDDRGEFLLVLSPDAAPFHELSNPLPIRVLIFVPTPPPEPPSPDLPKQDEFWDLPIEQLPAPGEDDPVSRGETIPPNYQPRPPDGVMVNFRLSVIAHRRRGEDGADDVMDFDF